MKQGHPCNARTISLRTPQFVARVLQMTADGATTREIAAVLNCTPPVVRAAINRGASKWVGQRALDVQPELLRLHAMGIAQAEIARRLGITAKSVSNMLYRVGDAACTPLAVPSASPPAPRPAFTPNSIAISLNARGFSAEVAHAVQRGICGLPACQAAPLARPRKPAPPFRIGQGA